jgi:hypothetical protein
MNYDDSIPEAYLQRYGINFSSENHIRDKLIFDTKFNFNQTLHPMFLTMTITQVVTCTPY